MKRLLLVLASLLWVPSVVVVQAPTAQQYHMYNKPAGPSKPKAVRTLASRGPAQPQTVEFEVTWYTAGPESTGKSPGDPGYGLTASGSQIKKGDCACDERYKFGTVFHVVGLGSFVCTDRGGAIIGNHIDIYTPSLDDAISNGKQIKEVVIK